MIAIDFDSFFFFNTLTECIWIGIVKFPWKLAFDILSIIGFMTMMTFFVRLWQIVMAYIEGKPKNSPKPKKILSEEKPKFPPISKNLSVIPFFSKLMENPNLPDEESKLPVYKSVDKAPDKDPKGCGGAKGDEPPFITEDIPLYPKDTPQEHIPRKEEEGLIISDGPIMTDLEDLKEWTIMRSGRGGGERGGRRQRERSPRPQQHSRPSSPVPGYRDFDMRKVIEWFLQEVKKSDDLKETKKYKEDNISKVLWTLIVFVIIKEIVSPDEDTVLKEEAEAKKKKEEEKKERKRLEEEDKKMRENWEKDSRNFFAKLTTKPGSKIFKPKP